MTLDTVRVFAISKLAWIKSHSAGSSASRNVSRRGST